MVLLICAWMGFHARSDFVFAESKTISGTVCNRPLETYDSTLIDLCLPDGHKVLLRFNQYADTANITRADSVAVTGELQQFEPFESDTGKIIRYDKLMLARGYDAYIQNPAVASVVSHKNSFEYIDQAYLFFQKTINHYVPAPESALVGGVLLGDKSGFSDDDKKLFRIAGISHIVVLSGFNITIIAVIVSQFFTRYGRRASLLVTAILTILFLILVGPTQSLMRASLMTAFILMVRYFGLGNYVMRALVLALIIISVINPAALVWDVSLHLSFLATLGLLVLASPLESRVFWWMPSFLELRTSLSTTVAATIAVLPITIFQFGFFSPVAIPINMLVLPFVPALMALGALIVVLHIVTTAIAIPFLIWIPYVAAVPAWLLSKYILWISSLGVHIIS